MIALRKARSTDAGSVGGILTEFAGQTPWMPKLHSGAEDIAHAGRLIAKGWVTVAVMEGQVVGFAARDGGDLDALYVLASARGTGVGTALLRRMQADHPVLSLWTFQANERAQRFYRRHGFVEGQRSDGARNDEGLPDVQYHWQREAG